MHSISAFNADRLKVEQNQLVDVFGEIGVGVEGLKGAPAASAARGERAAADEGMYWIGILPAELDLRSFLADTEKTLLQRALRSTHGAQAEAARRLGLSRSDLACKPAKYDIKVPASAGG